MIPCRGFVAAGATGVRLHDTSVSRVRRAASSRGGPHPPCLDLITNASGFRAHPGTATGGSPQSGFLHMHFARRSRRSAASRHRSPAARSAADARQRSVFAVSHLLGGALLTSRTSIGSDRHPRPAGRRRGPRRHPIGLRGFRRPRSRAARTPRFPRTALRASGSPLRALADDARLLWAGQPFTAATSPQIRSAPPANLS